MTIRGTFEFDLPMSMGRLVLDTPVLEHFWRHRQNRFWSREAGGQLFAKIEEQMVCIKEATGPRKTDLRSAFSYVPDRDAERSEIERQYAQGLHYVGDWHTHREKVPNPSSVDLKSLREIVQRSRHDLRGFFLVVVGTLPFPEGLYVSFMTPDENHKLQAKT